MKVFKESARIFKLHCYLSLNSANKWKHYGCVLYTTFFVVDLILVGWSSWCFFVKSILNNDKANAFCSLYQLVVVAGPLYSFFVAQFQKKAIGNNFADYQNFYDQNKGMDPMGFMRKAERRGRQAVKFFASFAVMSVSINFVTGLGSLWYHRNRYANFSNYTEVHRPYRYVLPWDQNTLHGWIWESVVSIPFPIHYFIISSGFLTLLVTICEYHRSFCETIDYHLRMIKSSDNCRMVHLRKMIHDTVSFHIKAKKLFVKSADLFSLFVVGELIHFMLLMTFVLFQFDYAIRNLSLQSVLMAMGIVYATTVLYLYCYCGQCVTDSYATIADHLYESDWLSLPIGLQRMYVLMIAHAQKELRFRGAGMVDLNLEKYLAMTKTVVGYVLMFKTFAEENY